MTLKNNRAPLLWYFKLCASFHSHPWIQNGGTVRKPSIWVIINNFLAVWPWNLTDDNRPPLLSHITLCASFHRHIWIQTGVTVRKPINWILTSVTLTFDLWPWHFAWISILSLLITPEHSGNGVTGQRTDEVFLELFARRHTALRTQRCNSKTVNNIAT